MSERRADVGADIGRGIRKLRKQKGWTQTELASATSLALPTISLIETAKTNPSIYDLELIAKALETSLPGLIVAARKSPKYKDQELIDYIGNAVRNRRLELGLTKAELGQRADLLPQYISTTENCRRLPSLRNLSKFANALNVEFSTFVPGEDIGNSYEFAGDKSVSEAFKNVREKDNLTIAEVGRITGLGQSTISQIERRVRVASLPTVLAFCRQMNIEVRNILSE